MKRVGLGVAALLLIGVGFGGGWFAHRTYEPSSSGDPRGEATALDEFDFWKYPKSDFSGSARSGGQYLARFTTADDLKTVASWYEQTIGGNISTDAPGAIGSSGGPGVFAASCDDSLGVAAGTGQSMRTVRLWVGARGSPFSAVTLTLSRTEGEDRTHIVISFSRR